MDGLARLEPERNLMMLFRGLLSLLGLFHQPNGLFMIADTEAWYLTAPGVSQTGPMNPHFIVDIGLAFAASGAGALWPWHCDQGPARTR
jgi:hypothetical protein